MYLVIESQDLIIITLLQLFTDYSYLGGSFGFLFGSGLEVNPILFKMVSIRFLKIFLQKPDSFFDDIIKLFNESHDKIRSNSCRAASNPFGSLPPAVAKKGCPPPPP